MSRPLNPNAISFTPNASSSSSSSSSLQYHHQLIPVATHVNPPSPLPLDLPFLPHHLQPTFYHHYPNPNQQTIYGFPPHHPPSTKLFDYKLVGTLDVYRGINNHGYCLKAKPTAGRSKCKKQHPCPPPPPPPPPPPTHRRQILSSTSKKRWRRKSVLDCGGREASAVQISKNVKDQLPKHPSSYESIQQGGTKTSVMIKNIPNRYCRDMLLGLLVDHCKEQNGKEIKSEVSEQKEEDLKEKDLSSAIDFVYLPIDFETKCNKGYAFVNFTNPNGVWRLYNFLNNYKWDLFNSKKICEVTYARIQGKDALIKHFNRSTFACEKDEYLPVYIVPYLDGSAQDEAVEVVTVGTRLQTSSSSQHLLILRRGDDNHLQLKRNHDDNEKKDGEDEQPRALVMI